MPVKKIIVEKANRLYQLPPDLMSFARPQRRLKLLKKTELLDLTSFRWPVEPSDSPPTDNYLEPADKADMQALKEALSEWYLSVHAAKLNPTKDIFIGSSISANLLALAMAFIDHGDITFVPGLGLPLYRRVVAACGGEAVAYAVLSKDNWCPNFERVGTRLGRVARVLFVNTPHNPTGAEMSEKEMADLVYLAGKENIMVVNDAAYQTIAERTSTSLLSVIGGNRVGVEVGSFAYHFGLPSMPLAFVVGNRDTISGLKLSSRLLRPFLFKAHIRLALEAIRQYPNQSLQGVRKKISHSAAQVSSFMDTLNLEKAGYGSIPFVWARLPQRSPSTRAANRLLKRSRILVAPGSAFGEIGEGYLRLSLTADALVYQQAIERLQKRRLAKKKADTT